MNFQDQLIAYRKAAGYKTGKEFAAVLGISYPSYMAFENKGREPKYETLCKIADALHLTIDKLIGHEMGDAYEYCKNLIESFEFELMEVNEAVDGTIVVSNSNSELCRFQSKEEFTDHVLAWEKSFPIDENYQLYFNLHMYRSMTLRAENQKRNSNLLQYIKESLDELIHNSRPTTTEQLKEILLQALNAVKTQEIKKSTSNESKHPKEQQN